jgi:5-methylcytosine-specific restriction endonuclease McrA
MGDPYQSAQYKAARLATLEAAGYRCAICGKQANTADHIVALTHGGWHAPENLRCLCRSCNSRGGGQITQAKRRAGRVGRRSRRW